MAKTERLYIRVDSVTKKTIINAIDEIGVPLSQYILTTLYQSFKNKNFTKKTKKKIDDEIRHEKFLMNKMLLTRKNNYRHQIYNACDNILVFASKSLRQHGVINMSIINDLIKDWKPVIKSLPLDMRKLLIEEVNFFYNLGNVEYLQLLFKNQKEHDIISTDAIFNKLKYLAQSRKLLGKNEIK